MVNEEWRVAVGKWLMESGERRTEHGKCRMAKWLRHAAAASIVHFLPAWLFFAAISLAAFWCFAAHAPTRLASVGFSPRFPFALLTSRHGHTHAQSQCQLPAVVFCARWPKVNP